MNLFLESNSSKQKKIQEIIWSIILDPPFRIPECRVRIRNQRPQKPASTKLHPNQVSFGILVSNIGPDILNLQMLISDS